MEAGIDGRAAQLATASTHGRTQWQLLSGGCNEGTTEKHIGVPIQQGANAAEAEKYPSPVKRAIKRAFRKCTEIQKNSMSEGSIKKANTMSRSG
jgi:hypothetical protein